MKPVAKAKDVGAADDEVSVPPEELRGLHLRKIDFFSESRWSQSDKVLSAEQVLPATLVRTYPRVQQRRRVLQAVV